MTKRKKPKRVPYDTFRLPRSMLVKVRCLGPGREHTFLSEDPRRNRVCGRCRGILGKVQYTPPGAEFGDDD